MPNHVTHRLVVTGSKEDIAKFKEAVISKDADGNDEFDFNKIEPRPKILEGTRSPLPDLIELFGCAPAKFPTVAAKLDIAEAAVPGVTREQLLEAYKKKLSPKRAEEEIKLAKLGQRAYETTGYYDWYNWSCANWGTKWNSYAFRREGVQNDQRMEFLFETSWSPPIPIFERLAERFPDLSINVKSFDEGWNYACAGTYDRGSEEDPYVDAIADKEMYEDVYGYRYEDEDAAEGVAEEAMPESVPTTTTTANQTQKMPVAPSIYNPDQT
jgi:hypothetical protein